MRHRALTAALLVAFSAPVFAQDAEDSGPWSFNLGIVSDYVFRGVSQTNEGPAWQLGADYAHDSGFYAGVWASRVDFEPGDDARAEVDLYIGYSVDLSDLINLDVSLVRYEYLSQSAYEYNELIVKLGLGDYVGFEIGYSNDCFNSGENGTYYGMSVAYPIEWGELTLVGNVGRYDLKRVLGDSYSHAYVGFSKEFGPMEVNVGYHNTSNDVDFGSNAGSRLALEAIWRF